MGYWVLHSKDTVMEPWLKEHMSTVCSYCGSEMENWYNDDIRCTNRRCSNPNCYGMMAAKGKFMMKILSIDGIGFSRCMDALKGGRMTHHVQLLSILPEKPTVSLKDYLRIHCFEGVDSEWEKICTKLNCYTVDDILKYNLGKWTDILRENKKLLDDNLQYVQLKKRPLIVQQVPSVYLTIMITGTPIGFNTKEHFISVLNKRMLGRIVLIHQATKRKTGVDYLIREPGSKTAGKVSAAIDGGIPIVTSAEFIAILTKMLQDMNSEKEDDGSANKSNNERSVEE